MTEKPEAALPKPFGALILPWSREHPALENQVFYTSILPARVRFLVKQLRQEATIRELLEISPAQLLSWPNLGRKSIQQTIDALNLLLQ